MFRPKELFIGLRYTRAKRRNHFVSFIFLISILGIALGVAALIIVLSVMNGFEKELRERILGMTSHASIIGPGGMLADWQSVAERVRTEGGVMASAPFIHSEAMLEHRGKVSGALIQGVEPEEEMQVSSVGEKMVSGALSDLQSGQYGIILGKALADALGAFEGDKITVITPQASTTPVGVMPRMKRFTVVGIYEVGMHEYDRTMALIHLDDARILFKLGDNVSGLRLKLEDMLMAPRVSSLLQQKLEGDLWVIDWTVRHSNLFKAIKTEKTAMFIILLLVVTVAAFNIVSTLVMTVTDKQSDIAILRTLGMTPGSVMMIFIIQGAVIGLIGTMLGVSIGVPVALNLETIVSTIEQMFHVDFLSADVYYISDLPSDLRASDVVQFAGAAFALTILATIYPAWRASRIMPVEALRYE